MFPVSRLTDIVLCTRPCRSGYIINPLNYRVIVDNLPTSILGAICTNCCRGKCPCPNYVVTGSPRTFINMLPITTVSKIVTNGIVLTGSYHVYAP